MYIVAKYKNTNKIFSSLPCNGDIEKETQTESLLKDALTANVEIDIITMQDIEFNKYLMTQ